MSTKLVNFMDLEKEGLRRFLGLCLQSEGEGGLEALLRVLLTPTEIHEIAFRVLILRELLQGERTQRAIAQYLRVSLANVTRGSNVLKGLMPEAKERLKRAV